ncbi:magnesium and cobalt transport protein CorA [Nocardioides guangzhouensis]|uniref:magnesium and cobalt transport protein CorA n=1 Tax=Nocardioides guangzhouensis TaxID=2497878 RepID=UPI001C376981
MIADCGVYENGRRVSGRISLDRAAEAAHSTSGFVWVGLQDPTAEDIAVVADAFGLPPLAVQDAVHAHQRPKLNVYDDVVFMVLKPVRYVDHEEVVDVSEIALFLGRNFVVTVRHGRSDVLGRVRAELDRGGSELVSHGPKAVLYRTADMVVDGYEEAITSITEDIDEIESQVFGTDEDDHAERIYKLKREVAEFRRAVLPLAAPLQRLADGLIPGIDSAAAPYFRDVHDHALRASDAIEGHDRLLSDVLQADLARVGVRQSKIAVRQNEDMRRISAWAAIALAPTAIAGIYGMNFEFMPLLTSRYGYFVILAVIGGVCWILYRLFRRSDWL